MKKLENIQEFTKLNLDEMSIVSGGHSGESKKHDPTTSGIRDSYKQDKIER